MTSAFASRESTIDEPVAAADRLTPVSRRIHFRPLVPQDLDLLYHEATSFEGGYRWRYRGATPSPADFKRALFDGVLAQYMAVRATSGEPVGLTVAYNANHANGFAYIAALSLERWRGTGLMMEGVSLFVTHVLSTWQFRKLYVEVPAYNVGSFGSAIGSVLHQEGTLRHHEYHAGQYWDLLLLAIYRADWQRPDGSIGLPFPRAVVNTE